MWDYMWDKFYSAEKFVFNFNDLYGFNGGWGVRLNRIHRLL